MARVIFDDWLSILHFLWGVVAAFSGPMGFFAVVLFVWYQRQEAERPDYTLGDVEEFLIGYVMGLQWFQWFQWKQTFYI